jgi:dolichol-phosphate mannosyltransferase
MSSAPPANAPELRLLSVVIPAHNEEACLPSTLRELSGELRSRQIPHEIVVVDDGSRDRTWAVLEALKAELQELRPIRNRGEHGFGRAVICGFEASEGDAIAIMMADASDSPADLVRYWEQLGAGWDCVFGSRFVPGAEVVDYPFFKWMMNRLVNGFIRLMFRHGLNDTTNAFKAYRRSALEGCRPFLSPHFNLTVELPLKAVIRGYSWTSLPISWRNRTAGVSKLKIKEMGSRYLFIILYCWLEKYFSRGDYEKERSE